MSIFVDVARASRYRRIIILAVYGLLIFFLVYPFETGALPELTFRVVYDESGLPAQGLKVKQKWAHYSAEFKEHEAFQVTDEEGYVVFPHRNVRSSLVMRALKPLVNLFEEDNAMWGPQAFIYAYVSDSQWGFFHYVAGELPPKEIVIRGSKL